MHVQIHGSFAHIRLYLKMYSRSTKIPLIRPTTAAKITIISFAVSLVLPRTHLGQSGKQLFPMNTKLSLQLLLVKSGKGLAVAVLVSEITLYAMINVAIP